MVRRVANTVDRRVAHVEVRAAHVDLEPEDVRAVGKLSRPHAAEEVEVFGDRAVAVGTVATGLRERPARAAHFLGRLAVDIRKTLRDEPLREAIQRVVVIGRVIPVPAPVVAEPLHRVRNGVLEFDILLERVGVIEAQVARTAVFGGESEIEDDRLGMPVMQVPIGLGRESGYDPAIVFLRAIVFGDHGTQEIGSKRRRVPNRGSRRSGMRGIGRRFARVNGMWRRSIHFVLFMNNPITVAHSNREGMARHCARH